MNRSKIVKNFSNWAGLTPTRSKAMTDLVKDLIEKQQALINELRQREAELAATVEKLREEMDVIRQIANHPPQDTAILRKAIDALGATAPTNLNAVKRAAILDAVEQNVPVCSGTPDDLSEGFNGYCEALHSISQYANQRYPDKDQGNGVSL